LKTFTALYVKLQWTNWTIKRFLGVGLVETDREIFVVAGADAVVDVVTAADS